MGEFEILKKRIIERRISGYRVPVIAGFKGGILDFKVLIVFCKKEYFDYINSLKKSLNLEKGEVFHPIEGLIDYLKSDYSAFSGAKNRGVFIDMGERTTSVAFFNESLELINTFLIGGYNFTKKISDALGISEKRAETLKEELSKKQLSFEVKSRIQEMTQPILTLWQKQLEERIKGKKVYLYGGGSLFPGIKESIESLEASEVFYFTPGKPLVKNKTKVRFSPKETSSLLLAFCKRI